MGFFDDSDDEDTPAPAPAPAPAPPVTAPTVSARRDPSDDLPDLPRVSIMDRLEQRSIARSTLPPAPMAAPPTPPQAVTREPKRKPFDEDQEEEVVGQCSSGAGSSGAPYRQLPSLAEINANYEARTNTLALEEVRKGKAPMRAASKGAPSGVGTADKGKRVAQRPRPTVEDLEEEALAYGSGDEEEEDGDEEATLHPLTPARPAPSPPSRARQPDLEALVSSAV